MSHSSGISVSADLAAAFRDARASGANVRLLKVSIENEALVLLEQAPVSGDLESDFASFTSFVKEKEACYLVFRQDATHPDFGYLWALASFVPDNCPVRHKMLYASTRDNLKKQLGQPVFTRELHATLKSELTFANFEAQGERGSIDDVLTMAEKEKREEAAQVVHHGATRAGVHGVDFPFTDGARAQATAFAGGRINFLQLLLNLDAEVIDVSEAADIDVGDLSAHVPTDEPRYMVFRYTHEFEGATVSPTLFVYSCPLSSKIKQRMMPSSCKMACIKQLEDLGISCEKRLEITDPDDLSEDIVGQTFHPAAWSNQKLTHAKPQMAARGGRRRPVRSGRGGAAGAADD